MVKNRLFLFIVAGLVVVGCNSSKPAEQASGSKSETAAGDAAAKADKDVKDSGSLASATPANADASGEGQSKPAVSIPAEMHNDASEYFGLKDHAKLEYSVKSSDNSNSDLTRELTATSAADKEVVVEESASSANGVQKFEHILKADGIYSRQVLDSGKKGEIQLELPAKLKAGKKWSNKATMETPLGLVTISSTSKVVGFEKVTVGKKTYDALKLQEQATLTGKANEEWKTTTWLAKGVGLVKMEILRTPKGQPTVKSTMTLK